MVFFLRTGKNKYPSFSKTSISKEAAKSQTYENRKIPFVKEMDSGKKEARSQTSKNRKIHFVGKIDSGPYFEFYCELFPNGRRK